MGRLEEGGVGPETVQGQEGHKKIRASTWEGQEESRVVAAKILSHLEYKDRRSRWCA